MTRRGSSHNEGSQNSALLTLCASQQSAEPNKDECTSMSARQPTLQNKDSQQCGAGSKSCSKRTASQHSANSAQQQQRQECNLDRGLLLSSSCLPGLEGNPSVFAEFLGLFGVTHRPNESISTNGAQRLKLARGCAQKGVVHLKYCRVNFLLGPIGSTCHDEATTRTSRSMVVAIVLAGCWTFQTFSSS